MFTEEQKQFKDRLTLHSKMCVSRRLNCMSEEACKQGLVLPFIALLGYDVFNISEVIPEHASDFSDKYKNRVDYVIAKDSVPVIAIECKLDIAKNDRGQLKSYFNACLSIKLGILTDGIHYEFFADNNSPNVMDDEPFLTFDFSKVAHGLIPDEQLKDISSFTKAEFSPENVGAEAKRKVIYSSIVSFLDSNLENPSNDFIDYMLRKTGEFTKITSKVLTENAELVRSAFAGFIDNRILERVGLADKNKKEEKTEKLEIEQIPLSGIVTTDNELKVYNYAKQRLAFLVDSDELYQGIDKVECKDYKTLFVVFYKQERRGKLFTLTESIDGDFIFIFPIINKEIKCSALNYKLIDEALFESYKKCFMELK